MQIERIGLDHVDDGARFLVAKPMRELHRAEICVDGNGRRELTQTAAKPGIAGTLDGDALRADGERDAEYLRASARCVLIRSAREGPPVIELINSGAASFLFENVQER